ncbi:putative secretion-regulating guanine nucleotide exchange factor [Apostichopus japonicus]|uniref:Putative secretion-regulating guanine nucleotide exchange factor n=1 Tax=Stichopus japonicus TaxID=307972 RepID=A0A2G8K6E1_STIJA|nr:putative secretion-regulating guanine nucleotide exchange factor [Apostichopus japonicus]
MSASRGTEWPIIFSWGANSYGQLSLGDTEDRTLPVRSTSHVSEVKQISGGGGHTVVLTYSSGPVKVEGFNGHPVRDVAAGIRHSLAVTDDGNVWTWGCGKRGQLGWLENLQSGQRWSHKPRTVSEEMKCRSVAAGAYHSLAITVHNRLFGWGDNKRGQLAIEPDKTAGTLMFSKPREISWNSEKSTEVISCVASGWTHVLILLDGGDVYSWGRNVYCQLGRPSECDQTDGSRRRDMCWKPAKVPHLPKIDHIACGSEHNIVLTANGEVYCWGWNEHGMCADGTEEDVQVPKQVATLDKFKTHVIGTGAGHCMVACS